VVSVEGGAILRVVVLAPAYDDNGVATLDPRVVDAMSVGRYQTLSDIAWVGSFEGQTTLGIGVRARLPFRVFTLAGPGSGSRLVIDVAHRWSGAGSTPTTVLPGRPIDGAVAAGARLAVMGVAHNDALNIRRAPGIDQRILTRAGSTAFPLVATGRARALSRSIWYEVTVHGVTGWASARYLAYVGDTTDLTAALVGSGPYPSASSMVELGRLVARHHLPEEPGSRVVMTVAPTYGDLAEVTFDVVGLADDSVAGLRLHIFATKKAGGGWTLRSIEASSFCARGGSGGVCV